MDTETTPLLLPSIQSADVIIEANDSEQTVVIATSTKTTQDGSILKPRFKTQRLWWDSLFLGLCILVYLASDVGSTIYYKKELNVLKSYPFVASQINAIITLMLFATMVPCA